MMSRSILHFRCFSSAGLLNEFGWFYDIFLSLYTLSTKDFFPAGFLQPRRALRQESTPPSKLGLNGVWVFELVWPILLAERLTEAGRSLKLSFTEKSNPPRLWFLQDLSSLLRFLDILPCVFVSDHISQRMTDSKKYKLIFNFKHLSMRMCT